MRNGDCLQLCKRLRQRPQNTFHQVPLSPRLASQWRHEALRRDNQDESQRQSG